MSVSRMGAFVALLAGSAMSAPADYSLFVAPNAPAGGDGSAKAPLASLRQARDAVRAARKAGKVAAGQSVTITLAPGIYRLESPFELEAADSGEAGAPVVYRAATPGTARLHGGATLAPGDFRPVTDAGVLARLDPAVRDKVLVCDVAAQGDFQPLRTSYGGVPVGPWLYVDGQPQTLARWPNGDWATFSKAVDKGLPDPKATDPALQKPHPGSFVCDDPRPARWKLDEGVWLFGYWTHDWADEVIRVAGYDPEKKVIALAAPHGYGIAGGTWGAAKRRFYALNLLEELDAPGEWYLDRAGKRLYYYPPAPLAQASIVLATLSQPLVKLSAAKHVKLLGLRVEFGHGDGIVLRGCEGVEIAGCVVANLAGGGIVVDGKGNTVRSCDLSNLGTTGIQANGGDRLTLAPARNLVVNNDIHHYGLFKRTYAPGIGVQGCGQVVRNNRIHEAPHNAVLFGGNEHLFELNDVYRVVLETGDAGAFYTGRDWTFHGNIIRHNRIADLGAGSTHLDNVMGVYLDDCVSGITVEGNLFLRAGRGIMVGGGRENPVLNNLFVDCATGMSIDSRGMTWRQWNNPNEPSWRLEDKAQRLNYTQPPWSVKYPRLAAIMSDSPREPLYNPVQRNVFVDSRKQACAFDKGVVGVLAKLEVADNLVVDTKGAKQGKAVPAYKGFRGLAGTADKPLDLGFVDVGKDDLRLREQARLLTELPAFQPIPCERIGLFQDEYRKALPAR